MLRKLFSNYTKNEFVEGSTIPSDYDIGDYAAMEVISKNTIYIQIRCPKVTIFERASLSKAFQAYLHKLTSNEEIKKIIIDLSKVNDVSSCFIGLLIDTRKNIEKNDPHIKFILVNASPSLRRTFKMLNIEDFLYKENNVIPLRKMRYQQEFTYAAR